MRTHRRHISSPPALLRPPPAKPAPLRASLSSPETRPRPPFLSLVQISQSTEHCSSSSSSSSLQNPALLADSPAISSLGKHSLVLHCVSPQYICDFPVSSIPL